MTDASGHTHAALVDILKHSKGVPETAFSEPWMARAFGLTLAVTEAGLFSLRDFQATLIESVGRHEKSGCVANESDYYTRWLEALTSLLHAHHLLSEERLSTTERTAVAEAAARKEHHHQVSRNPDGSPQIAPLTVA
jgi:nitrile hydratase accessory protein